MKRLFMLLMTFALMLSLCACGSTDAEDTAAEDEAAAENAAFMESMNIQKVEDYLYTATIEDYDYEYGRENAAALFKPAGCAAIRNGDFRGRNYDWTYDDQAYFVLYTPAKDDRHAVLGVAGSITALTADAVDSGDWNKDYQTLPFATLDGVNDAGVICNILVVPSGEAGITSGSNPDGEDLCASMLNRYVLDYADDVDEAIELIKNSNVYMPHTEAMDREFHWMISDPERTVMVEFVDNEMRVLEDETIATNFYLYNFDKSEKTLPRLPEGIERYNIIADGYDTTATKDGMMKMLQSIRYSKTYDLTTVPFWYSEYAEGDLDVSQFGDEDISDGDLSRVGGFADVITEGQEKWAAGRNNDTWITVFSAVYDMKNLTLSICAQENDTVYEYAMSDFE